ncbi:MAG: RIP metalloprotease RseP [Parvularculaceae bacterium]
MTAGGFGLEQLLALPIFIVAFVVLLSVIVFFHEFGHFSVARLLGVRVEVFSIGFGKTIARWVDGHGTEWRISMIPLGGYVRFFGDANAASQADPAIAEEAAEAEPVTTQFPRPGRHREGAEKLSPEERKYCCHFKPVWARAAIVAAGPIANFILSIAIFWCILMAYGEGVLEARIGEVAEHSAAAEAGFQPGDKIVAIDGRKIKDFEDLSIAAKLGAGEHLVFTVERDGQTITIEATPRRTETTDSFGNPVTTGMLGVRPDPSGYKRITYSPVAALGAASEKVWEVISVSMKFLGRLITGKEDLGQLGGPIKMAQYAGQSAMSGFDQSEYQTKPSFLTMIEVSLINFINFAALASVSIGFLNLLPVPVLDGGHLMYYAYEAIARRPMGARAQAIGFRVGIVLLASLMLFVTWNDISKLPLFQN